MLFAFVIVAFWFFASLFVVITTKIVKLRMRMAYLWEKATQERRNEYMEVFVFYRDWHCSAGFTMSRAYQPIIDDNFGWSNFGLINKAVIVIPIYHHTSRGELVAVGTRSSDRRKGWTFDVGAMGMCSAELSVDENAAKELYEELGITTPIQLDTVLMPHAGYGSILYVYKTRVGTGRNPPMLQSTDGTFIKIEWVENNSEAIQRYASTTTAMNPSIKSNTGALFTRNMDNLLSSRLSF
jgi:hypothetical protein